MNTNKIKKYLIFLVATLMVTSLFTVILNANNGTNVASSQELSDISSQASSQTVAYSANQPSMVPVTGQNIMGMLKDNNVPTKYAFIPNLNSPSSMSGSIVNPGYSSSPSPIGISDFGLYNNSGVLTGYSYRTSSFEGTVTVNNMSALYLMNNGPDTVSFQLNAVLNHVTLFGNSNYVYWTNNVMLYSTRTNELTFVSNVWNFSSPAMSLSENSIASGNGNVVPGLLYYYNGNTFTVAYPFTVHLYLNSTVSNRNTAVYFNYSIVKGSTVVSSGTYDTVQFNSTFGMPSGVYNAPKPYYLVNGNQMTPTGKTLNDVEFVMAGPGSGSTSSIYNLSSTMNLKCLNSNTATYSNVNSSYDFGSNVGETINGVSVYWTTDRVAHLNYGPSFLYGLWNTTKTSNLDSSLSNYLVYRGLIKPSNSFMFVSKGGTSFNATGSSWTPIPTSGFFQFRLPPSQLLYQAMIFMSNYDEHSFVLNPVSSYNNVTLTTNLSKGIYTPLYAMSNNQISNISTSGNGSSSNPYVVENYQYVTINQIFSKYSPYLFPIFSGVLIADTNASVRMDYMPNFQIRYSPEVSSMLGMYGLPSVNYMPLLFYNTANISLYGSSMITGWFSSNLAAFPVANVMIWNSTNFLVGNNQFSTMDSSLLIYNDINTVSNNVVWGNTFSQGPITYSSYSSKIDLMNGPLGITVYGSHNKIYNNYFSVQNTAYSPNYDIYTGATVMYNNQWNISKQNPSNINIVNGYQLFGCIIRVNYQGGNYWSDYDGKLPYYNAGGMIANGADYVPLLYPSYPVKFIGSGLAPGVSWGVNIDGLSSVNTSATKEFNIINGTYTYTIVKPSDNYAVNPVSGVIHVYGSSVTVNLTFTLITYTVTFTKQGLNAGQQWSVTFDGSTKTSASNTISFTKDNGTYDFSVGTTTHHTPVPSSGRILVYGTNVNQPITFVNVTHTVTFTQQGLPAGKSWSVTFNGEVKASSAQTISFYYLANGTYDYTVAAPSGYSSNVPAGSVFVFGSDAAVTVGFYLTVYRVTFLQKGLPSGMEWNVSLNGNVTDSTGSFLYFDVPNGNYSYEVSKVSGYNYNLSSGNVVVNGANVTVMIGFNKIPNPWMSVGLFIGGIVIGIAAGMVIYYYFFEKRGMFKRGVKKEEKPEEKP